MKKIFNILIIITLFLSMNLSVSSCAGRYRYLLEQCLKQADVDSHEYWERECESLGKEKGCRLPAHIVERVDRLKKEARENCFKKYPLD